jgi:Mg2+/Co2+ transporter CorB
LLLLGLSAFFSCAETAFMAVNRYRLKHAAHNLKKQAAIVTLKLLQRPDQLLSLVLVGNTVANVASAAIVTFLTIACLGDENVWWTTILLTLVLLVFAEAAPKTLAALYPEKLSRILVLPIYCLQKLFFPIISVINFSGNTILKLLGFKISRPLADSLSDDELRAVIYEANGNLASHYHSMLLGVIDLKNLTVDDVMISCHEIKGLDVNLPWPELSAMLDSMKFDWIPVYRKNINQLLGVLTSSDLASFLLRNKCINSTSQLIELLHEPYFIPEQTTLTVQLHNFKTKRELAAFVVDEYGEVLGMLTMNDILEEIVGEFTAAFNDFSKLLRWQDDGSCLIDGIVPVRDFNRFTKWQLPLSGPRTINGLITEHLETLPRSGMCLLINNYPIEIITAKDNRVKLARIFPQLPLRQY